MFPLVEQLLKINYFPLGLFDFLVGFLIENCTKCRLFPPLDCSKRHNDYSPFRESLFMSKIRESVKNKGEVSNIKSKCQK